MEMSPEELTDLIKRTVRQALDEYVADVHVCRIPISDDTARKIPLMIAMVEKLGEQSLGPDNKIFDRGIDIMEANHLWTQIRIDEWEPEYTDNHRWVTKLRTHFEEFEENNKWVTEYRNTYDYLKKKIGETVIKAGVLLLLALIGLGFWAKVKG